MDRVSVVADADGPLRVVLRGEIDYANAAQITRTIREAIAAHRPKAVEVDLSAVVLLDSSGIGVLVNAMRAAEEVGSAYRVEGPNRKVRDQLRITGLLEPFGLAGP